MAAHGYCRLLVVTLSRDRLCHAGRDLFSRRGYERTSTATIAREAGTSESQLVRHFGGKAGLLEAILNEGWKPINERILTQIAEATTGRDAILAVLTTLIEAFTEDQEFALISLFEGPRVPGPWFEVTGSAGFLQFSNLLVGLIRRGQKDGSFRNDLSSTAIAAALIGIAEGMLREKAAAERRGNGDSFSKTEIHAMFGAFLEGLRVRAGKRRGDLVSS